MAVSTNSTDPAIPPVGASRAESLKARDEAVVKALVGASSVLLLMAMFIVGVGTLAQVDKDIWEVVDDYFRSWICWVQWKVFFPPVFFPSLARFDWDSLPIGGFPFPGGAAIGAALFVLLAAAQAFCFKIQARGSRLAAGLAVLAAGALIAWLVIEAGHNKHGVQGAPFFRWGGVWHIIQLLLVGACLIAVYALCRIDRKRKLEMGILGIAVLGLGGLAVWNFCAPLNDASMRILWQLIQAGFAALVLLGGCVLLFRKRAGVILIHGGVALMMLGELFVGLYAVEQRMTIAEGETVGYAADTRSTELAIIDTTPADHDNVAVIPLAIRGKPTRFVRGGVIERKELPFDVQIVSYLGDSSLRDLRPGQANPATAGIGLQLVAEEARGAGGVKGGPVDMAAAYVKLSRKNGGGVLGVYLCAQVLAAQNLAEKVAADGKTYDVQLRFQRIYKPYSIELKDVRKDDYIGTSTPRNYSSDIRLLDPGRNVDFPTRIWMNNPLRYAGETFYQSGYSVGRNGVEVTDLQVVQNRGWMIPYVACMIVSVGMLAHFSIVLLRFLQRRRESLSADERGDRGGVFEAGSPSPSDDAAGREAAGDWPCAGAKRRPRPSRNPRSRASAATSRSGRWRPPPILVPAAVVLLGGFWFARKATPPRTPDREMKLEEFGKLPVVYKGRVQPFDTLARTSLRILSGRETFVGESGEKQPAVRWLLDVITESEAAERHRVFRIDNLELLDTLGLKRRRGFRYALAEFRPQADEFERRVEQARKLGPEELDFHQRKLLEFDSRLRTYTLLAAAFRPLPFPPFPAKEQLEARKPEALRDAARIKELLEAMSDSDRGLASMEPPLAVPADSAEAPWQPYATAKNVAYVRQIQQQKPNPATLSLSAVLDAYASGDARAFNRKVSEHQRLLDRSRPKELDSLKVRFEAYFNHVAPFYHLALLYAAAFVLPLLAWLAAPVWPALSRLCNSSAFWLIVLTFALHTLALIGRMYISGRPPVTNLYSSAVFVGWGCVALGLLLEIVYGMGIGSFLAAVSGLATLVIAHFLAADGDTFVVLQAVLDTQFWLAAHVVTVALGYCATFLAGLLGAVYIAHIIFRTASFASAGSARVVRIGGVTDNRLAPPLSSQAGAALASMIYGAVCFGMFFSLVGTVLGGLWADDSWGRFWGWDPKENGALIIVLFNALILHARWGGFVKQRGLAVLAVAGNIVTSWSWFGVNELGVGLHSYGFKKGVIWTLGWFVASQIVVILLGVLFGLLAEALPRRLEPR